MKYKFRLSYKLDNKFVLLDFNKIDFLKDFDKTEIKTIDEFTTHFKSYSEMLNYLKINNLIPNNINELFITFDVNIGNRKFEQPYAYNKTLFFECDKDKLKYSYIYRYFRDKIEDGIFMERIIEHYEKKYVYKDFSSLKYLVRAVKEGGIISLSPYSKNFYFEELDSFLDFIFKKKTKKGNSINYKNVRDFLCFISGEEPIKVKGNSIYETSIVKEEKVEQNKEFIEPDNITLKEYYKFHEQLHKPETFEAYQDGNDFIAPSSSLEIAVSLDEYAMKYCLKRDNGEYE